MKCWIVAYHHRHGVDTWPVFSRNEPDAEEITKGIESWEGPGSQENRDDESIDINGPYCIPIVNKLIEALETIANDSGNGDNFQWAQMIARGAISEIDAE